MTVLLEVISRELFMVILLAALGACPAAWLGTRADGYVKVALAPAIGLALAAGVFTSLGWFVPASRTYPLVPVLAVLSVVAAVWRIRSDGVVTFGSLRRAVGRCVVVGIQLLVLGVAVFAPATSALASHSSVGPTVYSVADADGYIASIDEMMHTSLRVQAATYFQHVGPWANFVNERADFYTAGRQELDQTTFSANVDELLGYGATKTWDAFLVAFILAGALAFTAAIRYVTRRSYWIAVAGGALVGGAFSLQLFFDTSEGAICGLAMLLPILIVGDLTLRSRKLAPAVVLGILASGLLALYPLFLSVMAGLVIGLVAVGLLYVARTRHRPPWISYERLPWRLAAFSVVALGLNFVATWNGYNYLKEVLLNKMSVAGFPQYGLSLSVVPSWLFQLRALYDLGGPFNAERLIFVVLLPALFVVLALMGLRRYSFALATLPILATSFASAGYERVANNCTYCEDRSLLPVVPMLTLLVVLGVVALCESGRLRARVPGIVAGIIVAVSLGYTAEQQYFALSGSAYYLTSAVRSAIAAIPSGHHIIEIEGFNEGPVGYAETPLVYEAASEQHWGQLSIPADYNEGTSLNYFTPGVPLPGPQFHPNYDYVLTRLGGVFTVRAPVESSGGVALEHRFRPLDVTADYGLTAPTTYADPQGFTYAWQPPVPIQFLVTGSKATTAYVGVRFDLPNTPVTVGRARGVTSQTSPGLLTVCIRATGPKSLIVADLHLNWTTPPRLIAMRASTQSCPYPIP